MSPLAEWNRAELTASEALDEDLMFPVMLEYRQTYVAWVYADDLKGAAEGARDDYELLNYHTAIDGYMEAQPPDKYTWESVYADPVGPMPCCPECGAYGHFSYRTTVIYHSRDCDSTYLVTTHGRF